LGRRKVVNLVWGVKKIKGNNKKKKR